jgi:hypothetical protein
VGLSLAAFVKLESWAHPLAVGRFDAENRATGDALCECLLGDAEPLGEPSRVAERVDDLVDFVAREMAAKP